jgi:hypothetical protein
MRIKSKILVLFVFIALINFSQVYAFDLFSGWSNNPQDDFLVSPAQTGSDFRSMILYVLRILMTVIGSAALLMLVYGGITYLTSASNEQRLGQAKKTISSAIFGFILALMGYVILAFIQNFIIS